MGAPEDESTDDASAIFRLGALRLLLLLSLSLCVTVRLIRRGSETLHFLSIDPNVSGSSRITYSFREG